MNRDEEDIVGPSGWPRKIIKGRREDLREPLWQQLERITQRKV